MATPQSTGFMEPVTVSDYRGVVVGTIPLSHGAPTSSRYSDDDMFARSPIGPSARKGRVLHRRSDGFHVSLGRPGRTPNGHPSGKESATPAGKQSVIHTGEEEGPESARIESIIRARSVLNQAPHPFCAEAAASAGPGLPTDDIRLSSRTKLHFQKWSPRSS